MELMGCQNLAVPADVMHHVVGVESSFNPYAIGVVGGRLARQPANLPEALATVRMLERRGFNFSLGLAQVNRYNLARYGLASYEQAFQACPNLQAGSRILAECHARSGRDWGKSFSCYYSGNFVTGFREGYVQKIYASMRRAAPADPGAIPVYPMPGRRAVAQSSYPMRASGPVPSRAQAVDGAPENTPAPAPAAGVAVAQPSPARMPAADATAPDSDLAVLQPNGAPPRVAPAADASIAATASASPAVPPRDAAFVF